MKDRCVLCGVGEDSFKHQKSIPIGYGYLLALLCKYEDLLLHRFAVTGVAVGCT